MQKSIAIRSLLAPAAFAVLVLAASHPAQAQGNGPAIDAAAVEKGRKLYKQTCQKCHGPNMVTPGNTAYDLRKFPLEQQDRFYNSVLNGIRAMPPWKGILDQQEVDAVWAYVATRGLQ